MDARPSPDAEGQGPGGAPVVMLHGLGRTPRSLRRLEHALAQAGFRPLNWGYPSRRHRLARHVAWLRDRLDDLTDAGPVHFVGHSLGALLIRGALSRPLPIAVGRVVMIAPPNRGAGVAERHAGSRLARWVFGEPLRDFDDAGAAFERLGVPAAEVGVIAGSRRFHPLNPISYVNAWRRPDGGHDGTVEVERTKLPGMTDFLVVPAHHTFICDHPVVVEGTVAFLRDGRFAATPAA